MNIQDLRQLEKDYIWDPDCSQLPVWRRLLTNTARMLILLVRDLTDGELNLRAMSLVYTTLLSMVPLLALSFSILKGFGVQNQLDQALETALAPLGAEKATQIADNLIGFVNNMNVGVLGAVGLGFLIFTVVSLMQKIESAFNHVWRVGQSRSFGERFTTFLSAITVGPLLIFSAIAVTGSAMNTSLMEYLRSIVLLGTTIDLIVRLLPFALVISAFTFLYVFIPNTRVKLMPALIGGTVAGILWEALSFAFAGYASGASNYQVVYATFATAIFFMIWLYLNWLVLLVGASIAFYRQHPEIVTTGLKVVHFNPKLANEYALSLLARVGRQFYDRKPPIALDSLADEFKVPGHVLEVVLDKLVATNVLAETDQDPAGYIPGLPFDTTSVAEVLEKLEQYQPAQTYAPPLIKEADVLEIEKAGLEARNEALRGLTLKRLVVGQAQKPTQSTTNTDVCQGEG